MKKRRKGEMVCTVRLDSRKKNGRVGKVARHISRNFKNVEVHVRRSRIIVIKEVTDSFSSPFMNYLIKMIGSEV